MHSDPAFWLICGLVFLVLLPVFLLASHSEARIAGLEQLYYYYPLKQQAAEGPAKSFVTLSMIKDDNDRWLLQDYRVDWYFAFRITLAEDGLILEPMFKHHVSLKSLCIPYDHIVGSEVSGVFRTGFAMRTASDPDIDLEFSGIGQWLAPRLDDLGATIVQPSRQ